jgi:hypothetical protein
LLPIFAPQPDGDVVHADFHGAVIIPTDAVRKPPKAMELVARREKMIVDMARSPEFTSAKTR